MKCAVCGDKFAISQMISVAHQYKLKLPASDKNKSPRTPITTQEIEQAKREMNKGNILKQLYDGHVPGQPNKVDEEIWSCTILMQMASFEAD